MKAKVVNKDKESKNIIRKQKATDGWSKACTRIEDARKKCAEKNAKKAELEECAKQANDEKEIVELKRELEQIEKELEQNDTEMKDTEEEEAKFKKEEDDANMEDVTEEQEVNDPDTPRGSIEA